MTLLSDSVSCSEVKFSSGKPSNQLLNYINENTSVISSLPTYTKEMYFLRNFRKVFDIGNHDMQ